MASSNPMRFLGPNTKLVLGSVIILVVLCILSFLNFQMRNYRNLNIRNDGRRIKSNIFDEKFDSALVSLSDAPQKSLLNSTCKLTQYFHEKYYHFKNVCLDGSLKLFAAGDQCKEMVELSRFRVRSMSENAHRISQVGRVDSWPHRQTGSE